MKIALAVSLLFGLVISMTGQTRRPSKTRPSWERSLTSRQIAEKVSKSLVLVSTKDADGDPLAQGSGFFFKSGFVATNLHVFERAWQGSIEVVSTGKRYEVSEIVGVDVKHDICVFKINSELTPTLTLSNSRQGEVGDDIYVASNPEGLKGSFSKGIISAMRKDPDLVQIDASISPGSSGGPVVNSRAEVIGIAVGALTSGQHLNFAVPVKFLSSLPLEHHLPVNVVGALAASDKADQKLKGPVRTVLIKKSKYRYSRSEDRCTEGEIRPDQKLAFDVNGYLTDDISYAVKGGILHQIHYEYNSRGFITRIGYVWRDGSRTESQFSEAEWIEHKYKFRHYSNTLELEDPTSVKYDSDGNKIEMMYNANGARMRDVYKYDLGGKLVENELYENGSSLIFSFRYTYEQEDRYGNWTRQAKLRSDLDDPCNATLPPEVVYREITYYSL